MNRIEILGKVDDLIYDQTNAGLIFDYTFLNAHGSYVTTIVMKTDVVTLPFVDLKTGKLFGIPKGNYKITEIKNAIKISND